MKDLVKLLFSPISSRYQELIRRVFYLETMVDHLVDPSAYIESEEVGFNGQKCRKIIFKELIKLIQYDIIVETGTWIGNTTGYMRDKSNLPIITCEINKQFHAIAQKRLKRFNNITYILKNSTDFLSELFDTENEYSNILFYLDAHWYSHLPLEDEIRIICNQYNGDFVIMIDDFEVPGDSGYGFDDYGSNKKLNIDNYFHIFEEYNLSSFYPRINSIEETGEKRGCIVLANKRNTEKLIHAQSIYKIV